MPQRLLRLPPGELERPQVIHGPNTPSLRTSNQSEAGGSSRDSSVAPSTSIRSSEAHERYSPDVLGSQPRPRGHVSIHREPSIRTGRTGNGTAPPLTGSPSSCISDLSILDGIGDRAFDKSMRLLQDGTVMPSLFQQPPVLECPWSRMTRCTEVFPVSDAEKLVAHTKKVHLSKKGRRGPGYIYIGPPTLNGCGFCDAKFQADSGDLSWSNMMAHVVKEHHMPGHRLAHARIVWPLVEYLWEKGLLTSAEYRELKPIKNAEDVPSPPGLSDDEDPIALVEERRHRGGQ